MQSSSPPKAPLVIAEAFQDLKDPRRTQSCDHPLVTIVVIAIAGVICGAEGWEDLEQFGKAKQTWFATFLDLPHGVPSHDTFRRVFSALRPAAFSACVRTWLARLAEPLAGKVVAIDGKTLRGVTRGRFAGTPLHLVHAWACEQRLLLGQVATEGAPGEQAALDQLLAVVDLRGAVVTTDANTCSSKTATQVRKGGGDYLLHLKANRGPLYTFVVDFFAAAEADEFRGVPHRFHRTEDRGHGRGEVRRVWAVPFTDWNLPEAVWPDLRTMVLVERTRVVGGTITVQRHYYLTSLPARARHLARLLRAHWGIENELHWTVDVQMGEDACAIRDRSGAENFATLRRIALMLLKREDSLRRGVRAKQKAAGWDHDYLLRVLSRGTPEITA